MTNKKLTKKELENEIKKLKAKLRCHMKEADIGCQALHEYRDNYSVLKEHLSAESHAYKYDLRPLAMGFKGTGKRALEALKEMPMANKRRSNEYKKACGRLK